MDRLETRELAYFLAVADELHFGRAATRLGIAQPALSKTVRQLERRLGVTLFERTSRAVALTEAGRVLSREARVALDAVSAAALRTQRAGTRNPHLILAMKPGGDAGLLPAILAAYERTPEVLPVEVVFGADPSCMLREGQADAALLYAPPDELGGLDTESLLTEAPVAVLPASHPLAHRASLQMADLTGENLHRKPSDPSAMKSISELMHLIALGRMVAVLPRVLTRPLRDDLTTVPMADLPPVGLLLAWPAHSTSLSVAALARAAATAIPSNAVALSGDRAAVSAPDPVGVLLQRVQEHHQVLRPLVMDAVAGIRGMLGRQGLDELVDRLSAARITVINRLSACHGPSMPVRSDIGPSAEPGRGAMSDLNELHVNLGCFRECAQVARI
jgi:DNA-binding transcriptional LysR family regulator